MYARCRTQFIALAAFTQKLDSHLTAYRFDQLQQVRRRKAIARLGRFWKRVSRRHYIRYVNHSDEDATAVIPLICKAGWVVGGDNMTGAMQRTPDQFRMAMVC